ncbi:Protein too many mouths [Apostasia shenzhenica]|uniref:Protein too many mouths n=1 Tax=Apostasia shenzhenica TaxID=1088818 RepID=A0A2I0B112_9ASPA|nr:Protein too many mouths [Apostasia shenzhenica]
MANSLQLHLALLLHLLHLLHRTHSEFTMIMPDSSALVDAPQTGFSALAHTNPDEQLAVYEIMAATGNSWASTIPDVCRGRWHGIECMPDSLSVYHVVSLSFGALSDDTAFPTCDAAGATLSPAVLRLPHLRSIFFYRCLSGNPQPIPSFLGRLAPSLRSLVLRENGHVGPMPQELGNLTALRVLDLHENRLSSSIPSTISYLNHLQLLDLSGNQLAGAIPELRSTSLSVLDLNRNRLHGQIPPSLSKCESLIKIDLSRNQLTGPIPDSLASLKELILLDLSHNSLSGSLPCSRGTGYPSLRALILNGNAMNAALIPGECFAGMPDLNTVIFSGMGLEGPVPESMGEMPSLRVLHLDGNKLNGSIPESFRGLEKLSELRLDGNRLTGRIPFGRETIWRMGGKLRVSNNLGLCFDMGLGGEALETMEAITYCNPETVADGEWESGRTITKHLSAVSAGVRISSTSSSAATLAAAVLQKLLLMVGILQVLMG